MSNKDNYQEAAVEKLTIAEWSEEDRPREKMERLGPGALSDAELLAILIGSGSARQTAVDLMKSVLAHCRNNLNTLGKMSVAELTQFHGIGPAKAVTILAACELGKRRWDAEPERRPVMRQPADIYNYMLPKMQDLDVEEFWVLLLNQRFSLIKAVRVSRGGLTETAADTRLMMREALLCGATVMAAAHNHPSGNSRPSRQDEQVTQRLARVCETLSIYLLDHVIVTDGDYYSFRDNGKLG